MKDSFIEQISLNKSINAVILASGRGSNARALMEYCQTSENQNAKNSWKICGVISDNPAAGVLQLAENLGIKAIALNYPKGTKEDIQARRNQYSIDLANRIKGMSEKIDFVICAGFMKILTKDFLDQFKDPSLPLYRVINIHPSLLPSFTGANGYADAFQYGVKYSGVTTHFVDEQVDHGPILLQDVFPRHADDTLDQFKARGLQREHQLYIKTLKVIQNNRLRFVCDAQARLFIKVNEE